MQKAKNGMIEQQKRQKSFLAKITSKVEDGVKDLVEKQKEFLEWAVGPEQVATFLEVRIGVRFFWKQIRTVLEGLTRPKLNSDLGS